MMKVIGVLCEINCQEVIRNDKDSVENKTWSQFELKLFKFCNVLLLRLQFFCRALMATPSGCL